MFPYDRRMHISTADSKVFCDGPSKTKRILLSSHPENAMSAKSLRKDLYGQFNRITDNNEECFRNTNRAGLRDLLKYRKVHSADFSTVDRL